jgi:hypothetical protein
MTPATLATGDLLPSIGFISQKWMPNLQKQREINLLVLTYIKM